MKKRGKIAGKGTRAPKRVEIESLLGPKPVIPGKEAVTTLIKGSNLDLISAVRVTLNGEAVKSFTATLGPARPRSREVALQAGRQIRPGLSYKLELRCTRHKWDELIDWIRVHPIIRVSLPVHPVDLSGTHVIDPDKLPIGIPGGSGSAVVYPPVVESVRLTLYGYELLGSNFTQNQSPSLQPGEVGHLVPEVYENGTRISAIAGLRDVSFNDREISITYFDPENSLSLPRAGTVLHQVKVEGRWSNEFAFDHTRPRIQAVDLLRHGYQISGIGYGGDAAQVKVFESLQFGNTCLAFDQLADELWHLEDASTITVSRDVPNSDSPAGMLVRHMVRIGILETNVFTKHHFYPSVIESISFTENGWEVRGQHLHLHDPFRDVQYLADQRLYATRTSSHIGHADENLIAVEDFLQPGEHVHAIGSAPFVVIHPELDLSTVPAFALTYLGDDTESREEWFDTLHFRVAPVPGIGAGNYLEMFLYWKDNTWADQLQVEVPEFSPLVDRHILPVSTSVPQRLGLHRFVGRIGDREAEKQLFFLPRRSDLPRVSSIDQYSVLAPAGLAGPRIEIPEDEQIILCSGNTLIIGTAGWYDYAQVRLRCNSDIQQCSWMRVEPDDSLLLRYTVPELVVDGTDDPNTVRSIAYVGIEVFFKVDSPLAPGMELLRNPSDSLVQDDNWTIDFDVLTDSALGYKLIYQF